MGVALLLWEAVTAIRIVRPDYLASPPDVAMATATSVVPLLTALLATLACWGGQPTSRS